MTLLVTVEEIQDLFSDVKPVPQDDGPDPVCVISYPPAFSLAYDYMRAVWRTKELSGKTIEKIVPIPFDCHLLIIWPHFPPLLLRAFLETNRSLPSTEPCQLYCMAFSSAVFGSSWSTLRPGSYSE